MFKDRKDAGKQLADKLIKLKNENIVVLAIPRGVLALGAIVSKTLNAPLDVALSKKIGHPNNKEYAIGAVSLEYIILTDATGVNHRYIQEEIVRVRKNLKERYHQFYKNRIPQNLKNKTVIIIDDGIATGNTILVTIALVKQQEPKKIIVAVPVGSHTTV